MAETQGLIKGFYDPASNTVQGVLQQDSVDRKITAISLQGPARSTFRLYRGTVATPANQLTASGTGGGADGSYDSTTDGAPLSVPSATDCLGVWSGGVIDATSQGTAVVRLVY